ncbi:MAG: AAA family ATPase [Deltaproteobacteria bacterium]|nr:AAA family ATPase [Deltaproteobacteria bacterium]
MQQTLHVPLIDTRRTLPYIAQRTKRIVHPRPQSVSSLSVPAVQNGSGTKERRHPVHLSRLTLHSERFPTKDHYPFNQKIFQETRSLSFEVPITLFLGENGTGKTTLLEALAWKCSIYIWRETEKVPLDVNPYSELLYRYLGVEWINGIVAGSFFSSQWFRHFAQNVDEWAAADPEMLRYFGGKSLLSQSHGESLMSYFRARYGIKGLYLLDEPETALSPRSQVEFARLLKKMAARGHAQFIVATHSPIILACPGARIYSFNESPVRAVHYEETEHYQIYRDFMADPEGYLSND